uniref:sn-1-specific diacylglycerol lipase ABHD11 n=1 Tax=Trichuris muris TaxID=70415 RepID=A0A5S6QZY9_TRIMR
MKLLLFDPLRRSQRFCAQRLFTNNSVNLAYDVTAAQFDPSSRPVLILHGLFGNKGNWRSTASALQRKLSNRVYTADLRNHGDSPHRPSMTLKEMAKDVISLIRRLDLGATELSLIGHSLGGRVATLVALQEPAIVQRLLLVDISPRQMNQPDQIITVALEALKKCPLRGDYSEVRRNAFKDLMKTLNNKEVTEFLLTSLNAKKGEPPAWKFNIEAIDSHMSDILRLDIEPGSSFAKPTCIIRGEKSSYVRDEDLPLCNRFFPHLEVHTVENVGHWVHSENPASLRSGEWCIKFDQRACRWFELVMQTGRAKFTTENDYTVSVSVPESHYIFRICDSLNFLTDVPTT